MTKNLSKIILTFLIFFALSFIITTYVSRKVEEMLINSDRMDFMKQAANYFEDYKNHYKVYGGYFNIGYRNLFRFKNDYYANDTFTNKPPYLPTDNSVNVVEVSNCKNNSKTNWDLVYQVSPDGSSYNLRACLADGSLSENYSKNPYQVLIPKSDSEKRDQERLAIVREISIFLPDNYNHNLMRYSNLQYYPNSNASGTIKEVDAIAMGEFTGTPVTVKLSGFNNFVTHGNCGSTTESSWNIVYEVSEDGNTYDLAACLESGGESKNFSTKHIHNY